MHLASPVRASRPAPLALLAGCLAAAAASTAALDRVFHPAKAESWLAKKVAATGRGESCVAVGGPAPPFCLPDVCTGRPVRLADFRGRPVLLIFGSFG
jgi:hypothetical protein